MLIGGACLAHHHSSANDLTQLWLRLGCSGHVLKNPLAPSARELALAHDRRAKQQARYVHVYAFLARKKGNMGAVVCDATSDY